MRTRMYGGVRGRKTKVGGKLTFVFLLLDLIGREKMPLLNLSSDSIEGLIENLFQYPPLKGVDSPFCLYMLIRISLQLAA